QSLFLRALRAAGGDPVRDHAPAPAVSRSEQPALAAELPGPLQRLSPGDRGAPQRRAGDPRAPPHRVRRDEVPLPAAAANVPPHPPPAAAVPRAPPPPPAPIDAKTVPSGFLECEGNACDHGDAGAWIFHGQDGEARWPSGAAAKLRIERFDAGGIVIRRTDVP